MIVCGHGDPSGYIQRVNNACRALGISPNAYWNGGNAAIADLQDDDGDADEVRTLRAQLQLLELEASL